MTAGHCRAVQPQRLWQQGNLFLAGWRGGSRLGQHTALIVELDGTGELMLASSCTLTFLTFDEAWS